MSVFQTPWKLVGRSGNDFEQIKDADGNVLIEEIGFDLGMLIVKAVNHNDLIVDALQRILPHPLYGTTDADKERAYWEYEKTQGRGYAEDVLFALDALAKATGVKP